MLKVWVDPLRSELGKLHQLRLVWGVLMRDVGILLRKIKAAECAVVRVIDERILRGKCNLDLACEDRLA